MSAWVCRYCEKRIWLPVWIRRWRAWAVDCHERCWPREPEGAPFRRAARFELAKFGPPAPTKDDLGREL